MLLHLFFAQFHLSTGVYTPQLIRAAPATQVMASEMKMSNYYYPPCPTGTFHQCPETWDSGAVARRREVMGSGCASSFWESGSTFF